MHEKYKFFFTWLLFLILVLGQSYGYEKPDAFIVKIYDEKVRVLSPAKYDPKLSVIIENKTLVIMKGKLETSSGQVLKFISVAPGKSVSVGVKKVKAEKVYFIPLSPPLQKVELKIGNKPYEIPPKQKS